MTGASAKGGLLLISTSFPDQADGSEAAGSFVADVVESLAERTPVTVVAPASREESPEDWRGIPVYRFASPGKPLSLLSPGAIQDWWPILATLRSLRKQALRAAAERKPEHVLALWCLPSGWAARGINKELGIPYSVWALGSDIWTIGKLPVARTVLRNVARHARFRFADGHGLAEDAANLTGVPFEFLPSTRAPLNVASCHGPATSPPYRLLYLGRWHHNKGVDLLADALDQLTESDWKSVKEIHIAGGGPLQALVHRCVERLKAQGRPVRLSGYLDREGAGRALEEADILLLPSRIESVPLILSDALNAGLPIIATPVGDLPSLWRQAKIGELADSASPEGFAEAMRVILRGPRLPDFTPAMQRLSRTYSFTSLVDQIARLPRERTDAGKFA